MNSDRERIAKAPPSNNLGLLIIVAGLVMLLLGGFYIWSQRQAAVEPIVAPVPISLEVPLPAVVPEPIVEEEGDAPPVFEPVTERNIVLPPDTLDGSDPYVKKAIADFGPALSEWLLASQQLRKWVLTIDLMAEGELMKQDRPLKYPMESFRAKSSGEDVYIMVPENYSRTVLLVDTVTAMDSELLVYYYGKWSPLLEKAYQELGKKGHFHGRVKKSIERLLAVQPLTVEPLLEKKGGVVYRYVDAQLEGASDVEKMLWRMGPDNSAKLQAWLKKVQMQMPK